VERPLPPPPGGPGGPGDPGPGSDRTAPVARIDRATLRRRVLILRVSFPNEKGSVSGAVRVPKLSGATAHYLARPGRPAVVRLRLRALARRTVVTIRALDAAGNSSMTKRRVKLRAP
jgi:hypothetical protein